MLKKMEQSCSSFQLFKEANTDFLKDPVIDSFLQDPWHYQLFIRSLCDSSQKIEKKLNEAFQKFYTKIKIVHYLSKTLYWEAVNYDKRERKQKNLFPLLVNDESARYENMNNVEKPFEINQKETIVRDLFIESFSKTLEEKIENPLLYEAYHQLTDRQQEILNFIYNKKLTFIETAQYLNISQQGVSRIHQQALKNLKKYMSGKKKEKEQKWQNGKIG